MAEGGKLQMSFNDSFSRASGDADESFCDPCRSEGKWIAVEGYCQICDEYFCDTCLGVHRRQKITRGHAILDKNLMPMGQGSVCNTDICVEVCKTHHPEIIRFYCKGHDEPGCGDCMTLKHTSCKKDRVQDISDDFEKTKEFKDINKTLQQFHQELEEMEDVLDNNLKNLNTTYHNLLRKITSVRKQMNEYLDQIQEKITSEAAQIMKEDETELKTVYAHNRAMKAEIEVMLRTIHDDSNVNVNSLFVITKLAKPRLVTMEKEIRKIKQSRQHDYEFHISNEIEKIVTGKTPLGKLSRKTHPKVRTLTKNRDQRTPRAPTIDVTATYNRSINVKCEIDNDTCFITDCTLLRPDSLVVIDRINKNVKLIDIINNNVISIHSTTSAPSRVTALTPNMIAVTLPDERKIQLFDAEILLTMQRVIKVNGACYGIAYKDGKFAVSYMEPGRVIILNIQGMTLHTIQPRQGRDRTTFLPFYISFGQDDDTVVTSDYTTHTVSVVTLRGQILRIYTHDILKDPRGMVITADGVLFVCSFENDCIHVVSPDFKTNKIIINNDINVVEPRCITYCDIKHRLFISSATIFGGHLNNNVQVYDLNK